MAASGGDGNGIDMTVLADPEALVERAVAYIASCDGGGVKGKGRFANLAGFCAGIGVGVETFRRELSAHPDVYDRICAMFEDAALNSDLTGTVISAYLKSRLGYGEKSEVKHSACEVGDLQLVFEHDIYRDGE